MTPLEAIQSRRSIRHYNDTPLPENIVSTLQQKINEVNAEGDLNIQLVTNEPKGFNGILCYGTFSGVKNYFVVAGKKSDDLDERVGYYGEKLVLLAEQLGLNTCWAGVTYKKVAGTYTLNDGEKIVCYISLGYGNEVARKMKRKTLNELSNIDDSTPDWFRRGMEAVQVAPTAVNQQKFYFEYIPNPRGKDKVKATKKFSLIGYTQLDLGIAKLHFEIGAGKENFEWG